LTTCSPTRSLTSGWDRSGCASSPRATPSGFKSAQDFQDGIDDLFNFQAPAARRVEDVGHVPQRRQRTRIFEFDSGLTIAREARLLAGFTDEEIDRLVKAASRSAAY
jgi:hypothetical protein